MKLIIEGYNKSIHKRDNQILIKEKDVELDKINVNKIDDILIIGKGSISFDALRLISKNNIKLMSVDYFGNIDYILEYPNYENLYLRKQQYKFSENHNGLNIAREMIKSKMLNQKFTIKTLNKRKNIEFVKDREFKINGCINELNKMKFNARTNVEKAKMKIMGVEGKASNEYWESIKYLFSDDLGFEGRSKRNSSDITNMMLNYGYAILASQITKSLVINGLDPFCGFLHFDMGNRTSLSFDLIEEFRQQLVDKVVFYLLNTNQISIEDIDKRNNSIKLEKRKLIISSILNKLNSNIKYKDSNVSYSQIIDLQSKKLVNCLISNEKYEGFYLRW